MESDCESNTSIVAPPLHEIPYEFSPPVHVKLLKAAPRIEDFNENYIRPDYGINQVILGGKWNIYPTLPPLESYDTCSLHTATSSKSQSQVEIEENSLIHCDTVSESDPLISSLPLCISCKKRYTSRTRHNYVVILLLVFVALLSTVVLFPWGLLGMAALLPIPTFVSQPVCKKCRRKCC